MTIEAVDLYAPCAKGSLMRSLCVHKVGRFRLSRRACELYSVQISGQGSWARARVMTGEGRELWYQPSVFSGSFWLSAGSDDGLIVELHSSTGAAPVLTINWRESDAELV